jgi:hypothetical protein
MSQSARMNRILPLSLLALLAACSDPQADRERAAADAADKVECALAGATAFERVCSVERMSGPEGLVLTIRAPSGSFRRFLVTKDGRGVVAADGAEAARVTVLDPGRIEVALGGDRYRLPATVKK